MKFKLELDVDFKGIEDLKTHHVMDIVMRLIDSGANVFFADIDVKSIEKLE